MKKPPVNLTMCSSPRLETRGIACNSQGFDERTSEKKEEVEDGLLLQAGIIPRETVVSPRNRKPVAVCIITRQRLWKNLTIKVSSNPDHKEESGSIRLASQRSSPPFQSKITN
ncbi:hypothetical protein ABEW05_008421 [Botrytis cinerea]